jgi:transcriptional regulator with GAF, ATPase, and Fis domain
VNSGPAETPAPEPARSWRERLGRLWAAFCAVFRQPVLRCRAIILVGGLLVAAYVLGVLLHVLLLPEIGLRCAFSSTVNHFYSDYLYPPEKQQEPLRLHDQIVKLGNHPVTSWPLLMRYLFHLDREEAVPATRQDLFLPLDKQPGGVVLVDDQKLVRVEFRRPGEDTDRYAWCRIGTTPVESLLPTILYLILNLGLLVVGAVVFWQRPEDRAAGQFFVFCAISVVAFVGGYHWGQIIPQSALLLGFMFCAILLPAASLHLFLVFPQPRSFYTRAPYAAVGLVYAPAIFFFLLILTGYLRVRWMFNENASPDTVHLLLRELLAEIYACILLAVLYFAASIACLIYAYRKAANVSERKQVEWVLLGYLAAVLPIAYTLYLAYFQQGRFGGGAAVWSMFAVSVCMTVAFTVSITRYKLMELDSLLSSGVVYFLLSFVAAMLYYGLVFVGILVLGSAFGDVPSLGQLLAVCGTALLLVVALDLIRTRLKNVLDRHFRKEKHQLDRTLLRMRETLEQLVEPPTLARRLLQSATELLGARRGAVYLRQGEPTLYALTATQGTAPALTELPPGCPLIEALPTRGCLRTQPRSQPDAALRQLHFLGGELALGLIHENQLLGLVILGPRDVGTYSADDLAILTAFAQLAALALAGAEGHRTIEGLNRELQTKIGKIAEQQRRILALQAALSRSRATPASTSVQDSESEEEETPPTPPPEGLIGSSTAIRQLTILVRKVAASPSAVLLRGESGTGKEVLARAIHDSSPRAKMPFIKVHCAALSPGLLESELFGHVKGAFTSAIRDKVGRFESADGGTLFLDEIGDISLEVQTKLLRVLQEMTFERVGSSEPIRVDVRIIAATHQNLELLIRQGKFREDLFYRLNVFPIYLPPLRDRPEDIPELVQHFLTIYAQRAGKGPIQMDDDALIALKGFPWPGNVRQLENVIERAVVVVEGHTVTLRELPLEVVATAEELHKAHPRSTRLADPWLEPDGPAVLETLRNDRDAELAQQEQRERDMMVRALAAASGNKSEAARALGMARSTFLGRLKKLGLG